MGQPNNQEANNLDSSRSRTIATGLVADSGRLQPLIAALASRGIRLAPRPVALNAAETGPLDILLVDAGALDITPQHMTQRIRVWGVPHFIVVAPAFELSRARTWLALGALEYVAADDADRVALVLEQFERKRHAISSDLLQTVIDAVPAPIFFKDERGIYLGCNRAFAGYIGVSPQQIVGMTVYDLAPPDLADVYYKADRDLLESGGQQVYEAKVKYKDGSVHDIMFHKAVFPKRDGSRGGLVGAMLDITERKHLEEQLEKLATLDPLTGLYNRRSFMALSARDLSRCRRERQPASVMVIDVDDFKRVNDAHGHAAGDAVLVQLARTLQGILRQHDIVARTGGEEFFVTLGNTDLAAAQQSAERLCRALAAQRVEHEASAISVTASVGVTRCDVESETLEAALRRADQAMYEAKRLGRNRVVVAPGAA